MLHKVNSVFTLRVYISLAFSHLLIPRKLGDQYLASFPRSGNTWMRTMLGVLIDPSQDGDPDFTNKKIPGVSLSNIIKIHQQKPPRIISTHSWYRKNISRAVYLIRDGRDVLVSLYHYYITRAKKDLSFPVFINEYFAGRYGQRWNKNVASWLVDGKKEMGDNLLILHYEGLKKDTFHTLQKTARFLNISTSEDLINKAIEKADLERMRKIEIQRRGPIGNLNASFYRGGKSGEWIDYFTPQIEKAFYEEEGEVLKLAGYL